MKSPDENKRRSIAVDFDGTLATYDGWKGTEHLGDPVSDMIAKVKAELAAGSEVFIFTARVHPSDDSFQEALDATHSYLLIAQWCVKHIGQLLPITHEKSRRWQEMWDDKGKQVLLNTGVFLEEMLGAAQ